MIAGLSTLIALVGFVLYSSYKTITEPRIDTTELDQSIERLNEVMNQRNK